MCSTSYKIHRYIRVALGCVYNVIVQLFYSHLAQLHHRYATAPWSNTWNMGKCITWSTRTPNITTAKQSTAKSLLQKVWDVLHSIRCFHYIDVIMTTRASQIISLTFVNSTVYSDADQRKHQSSTSLAFVWGIHRDRWIPRTKRQLRGKCFHLMTSSCHVELAGVWTLVLNNQWSVVNGLWSVSVVNDTSRWTEGDRFHKDKYVPQYIYSIHSNVYKTRYESHIADILHGVLV